MDKGTYCWARQPELNSQNPHDGRTNFSKLSSDFYTGTCTHIIPRCPFSLMRQQCVTLPQLSGKAPETLIHPRLAVITVSQAWGLTCAVLIWVPQNSASCLTINHHKVVLNILYYGTEEHKESTQALLPGSYLTEESNNNRHLKGQKVNFIDCWSYHETPIRNNYKIMQVFFKHISVSSQHEDPFTERIIYSLLRYKAHCCKYKCRWRGAVT